MQLARYMENRYFRCGRKGFRGPYRVVYPWAGWGAKAGPNWGFTPKNPDDGLAHRSWTSGSFSIPEWGIEGGSGEPVFELELPEWKQLARSILTRGNSKMNVLEWQYPAANPQWWNFRNNGGDPTYPPRPTGVLGLVNKGPCPVPMSGDALWKISANWHNDDDVVQFSTTLLSNPGDIGEEIEWDAEYEDSSTQNGSISEVCRRILCFKDCWHTGASLMCNFGNLIAIVREAESEGPYPRLYPNDSRSQPFGWVDPTERPAWPQYGEEIPVWYQDSRYEMGMRDIFVQDPPVSATGVQNWGRFQSMDIINLSWSKLFSGMAYASQPWHVSTPVHDGLAYLEAERPFDLVLECRICKMKVSVLDGAEWKPAGSRFAGIYGSAYAIY